jgi:MarR-like DNA-binding transcriptional regulator SgrR of sgrS sRNA
MRWGADGKPVEDLAAGLEQEGSLLVVRLRPDARFHDGRSVTARDALASLERWLELEPEGPSRLLIGTPGTPRAGRIRDASTLELELAGDPELARAALADVAASVLPQGKPATGLEAIGAGPFRVAANRPGAGELELRPWLHWPRGRPYLDELVYKRFPDLQALVLAHRFQGVGIVGLGAPLPRELDRAGPARMRELEAREVAYLRLNRQRGALSLEPVRRAINAAVDRRALVDVLLRDEAEPAHAFLRVRPRDLDPLAPGGAGEPVRGAGMRMLLVTVADPLLQAVAERIQVDLDAHGIAIESAALSAADYARAVAEGRYDLALDLAWVGAASRSIDLMRFMALNADPPAASLQGASPEAALAFEAQALEATPVVFLFQRRLYVSVSEELKDLALGADGPPLYEGAWKLP